MKQKILPILLIAALLLSACGSASKDAASAAAMAMDAPRGGAASSAAMAPMMGMANGAAMGDYAAEKYATAEAAADIGDGNTPAPVATDRKIVKNAWLSLETLQFDSALDSLGALVTAQGGYIESIVTDGQSLNSTGYSSRYGTLCARIPADRLDAFLAEAGGLCNVVSKRISSDDISDSYYDSQARLESMQLREKRLLELLEKAENLEEIIQLESALSEVRYEIEGLTGSLRRMDSMVAMSSVNIDLCEVVEYQETVETPKTFSERLADAFRRSGKSLSTGAENLLFFLIEALPAFLLLFVLPVGLLVALIVWIVRLFIRIGKKKRPAKKTAPPAPLPPQKTDKNADSDS